MFHHADFYEIAFPAEDTCQVTYSDGVIETYHSPEAIEMILIEVGKQINGC